MKDLKYLWSLHPGRKLIYLFSVTAGQGRTGSYDRNSGYEVRIQAGWDTSTCAHTHWPTHVHLGAVLAWPVFREAGGTREKSVNTEEYAKFTQTVTQGSRLLCYTTVPPPGRKCYFIIVLFSEYCSNYTKHQIYSLFILFIHTINNKQEYLSYVVA